MKVAIDFGISNTDIAVSNGTNVDFFTLPSKKINSLILDEIFNYLSDDENLVFEQEPLRSLVQDKELLMYRHFGFWQPMDTSREYQLLTSMYNTGKAPWI
mgnify:CR=1 FL=1